jgi:filamentous hemagglutinin
MTPPIVTGTSGSKWTNLTFSSGQDNGSANSGNDNTTNGVNGTGPKIAGPLVPRVDVADNFVVKTGKNGSTTLQYGNPEGAQGLIVNVDKDGVLGFDIRADNSSISNPSGTDMFASAMQRLNQNGVQVSAIRGAWVGGTDSINTAEYMSNLKNGMTPQQAAANTWTGRMAANYGFTDVQLPTTSLYSDATYVIFKKP